MAPARRRPRESRARRYTSVSSPVHYADVELLGRFLTDRGRIKARSVTGLSRKQQAEVARAIKRARELALLPYAREGQEREGRRRGRAGERTS